MESPHEPSPDRRGLARGVRFLLIACNLYILDSIDSHLEPHIALLRDGSRKFTQLHLTPYDYIQCLNTSTYSWPRSEVCTPTQRREGELHSSTVGHGHEVAMPRARHHDHAQSSRKAQNTQPT